MAEPNVNWNGALKGPRSLGSASLGTEWGNIGSAFSSDGVRSIAVFTGLDVGSSNNSRARLVGRATSAGSAHPLPRQWGSGTATLLTLAAGGQAYQYSDADQRQMLAWDLSGAVPFVQLQGQVGTVGTPAAVLEAEVFTSL